MHGKFLKDELVKVEEKRRKYPQRKKAGSQFVGLRKCDFDRKKSLPMPQETAKKC